MIPFDRNGSRLVGRLSLVGRYYEGVRLWWIYRSGNCVKSIRTSASPIMALPTENLDIEQEKASAPVF